MTVAQSRLWERSWNRRVSETSNTTICICIQMNQPRALKLCASLVARTGTKSRDQDGNDQILENISDQPNPLARETVSAQPRVFICKAELAYAGAVHSHRVRCLMPVCKRIKGPRFDEPL